MPDAVSKTTSVEEIKTKNKKARMGVGEGAKKNRCSCKFHVSFGLSWSDCVLCPTLWNTSSPFVFGECSYVRKPRLFLSSGVNVLIYMLKKKRSKSKIAGQIKSTEDFNRKNSREYRHSRACARTHTHPHTHAHTHTHTHTHTQASVCTSTLYTILQH